MRLIVLEIQHNVFYDVNHITHHDEHNDSELDVEYT